MNSEHIFKLGMFPKNFTVSYFFLYLLNFARKPLPGTEGQDVVSRLRGGTTEQSRKSRTFCEMAAEDHDSSVFLWV